MDAGRRLWLKKLAAACERVLADEEVTDTTLNDDVASLLSRLSAAEIASVRQAAELVERALAQEP